MGSKRTLGQTLPSQPDNIHAEAELEEQERFQCPICGEFMLSVGQMNRHLDDVHFKDDRERQDYQESQSKDVVTNWLRSAQRHFQEAPSGLKPSGSQNSVNNDSVSKRLESFSIGKIISLASGSESAVSRPPTALTEHQITTAHWVESETCCHSKCSEKLLGIGGIRYGSNCRKCGKSFCDLHLSCQMKLSAVAEHDPENGVLYPVCHDCFCSRKGYRDFTGKTRSRNLDFTQIRQARMDKMHLESNLVQLRLGKLSEIHTAFKHDIDSEANMLDTVSKWRRYRTLRDAERSLVDWKEDSSVINCSDCQLAFNRLLGIWKHHCRLCGDIICGTCLKPIELTLSNEPQNPPVSGRQRFNSNNSGSSFPGSLKSQLSFENLSSRSMEMIHACKKCFRMFLVYLKKSSLEEIYQKDSHRFYVDSRIAT